MPNLYEILRSICFALWQIRSETEIAAVQFMVQLFFLAGDLCRSWFRRIDQTIRTRCCQDKNPHARPVNMSSKWCIIEQNTPGDYRDASFYFHLCEMPLFMRAYISDLYNYFW